MSAGAHRDDWINEDHEIRLATNSPNRFCRIGITHVKMRSRSGGKMTARRETHDPDPIGLETPLHGIESNRTQSPLGVE